MSKKLLQAAAGNAGEALYVEDVFSTYLYTGTGSALDIVNGIDLDGEGGAVWIKNRSNVSNHALFDTERGAEKLLFPDDTAAEQDRTADNDSLGAFNADGFSLQASAGNRTNESGSSFASWTFRKAEKFFDVVTYTGDGVAGRTISHNLGSVPGCIIVKRTNSAASWYVYHRGVDATAPEDYVLLLDQTLARIDSTDPWNDTAPTSTEFTVGSNSNYNGSGDTYVAYLFAHDAGGFGDDGSESIIKCGSYTGTGSAGNKITLGFEPQWLLVKNASTGGQNWEMFDNMRGVATGGIAAELFPNTSNAERAAFNIFNFNATGFETESTLDETNANGDTYIYIAIRRPMKTPESGTEVFAVDTAGATAPSPPLWTSGFITDFALHRTVNTLNSTRAVSRLTGEKEMFTNLTNAEGTDVDLHWDYMNGFWDGSTVNSDQYSWMFKRATGFFDVVCYKGTGSAHAETHNLGVVPKLIIVKNRDAADAWAVYVGDETDYLVLNTTAATADDATYWNDTAPTSTQFTVGTQAVVNTSGEKYVAYLFATLAGISKVGSYTGNGTSQTIDCGFSGGARFILIKSTSTTGSWWVYDSARGIVAGNDPALQLNSNAAEVTSADAIDPDSSGFIVNQEATCSINASGVSYIFMSIA